MKETTEISLDLSCRHAPLRLYAKQGDIGSRSISARFTFGGKKFDMRQVKRTEIRVKKPDGTITVNAGTIYESYANYPLTDQSLNVSGEGQADFLLYGHSGEVISCIPARLTLIESPVGDEAVVSTNEYAAFRTEFDELQSDAQDLRSDLDDTDQDLADFRAQYASQMSQLSLELSRFGGLRFKTVTKSEYESLEPDPATVYYVTDGNKVTQYFGAVKLTSGASTAGDSVALSDGTAAAVAGAPQSLEED